MITAEVATEALDIIRRLQALKVRRESIERIGGIQPKDSRTTLNSGEEITDEKIVGPVRRALLAEVDASIARLQRRAAQIDLRLP